MPSTDDTNPAPQRLVGRAQNENPLESIHDAIALSPHDWSTHHRLAWIYGIACGWDDEYLVDIANKHKWTPETIDRLKRLRKKFIYLQNVGLPNSVISGTPGDGVPPNPAEATKGGNKR